MKKVFSILSAVLLTAAAFQSFGQDQQWVNYSNFTAVTDVEPVGEHLWITAKGGVLDLNTTTNAKTYYKQGDAGLPSSAVEQIAYDASSGTIWVGTYDAGVVEWDGDNWLTYDYPMSFLMYRMKMDGFGNIWLQTDAGLYKFDRADFSYTFINSVGGAGWSFEAWDFDITPDNHVLIFTGEDCLVIDAVTNMAIDSFPNTESPVVLGCSPSTVRIYGADADTYLINNSGSLEFQHKDGTFEPANIGIPEFAFINNITRGTDNNLYALVNSMEIYQLVGDTWELKNTIADIYPDKLMFTDGTTHHLNTSGYMAPPTVVELSDMGQTIIETQKYNFNSNSISGITVDDAGDIFMSSATTIYKYNAAIDDWDMVTAVPTIYGSMIDLRFKNGNFYTIDNGNLIEYYNGTEWQHIPIAAGYESIYIYDFDITDDGTIYFTNDEGLFKYKDGVTINLIETGPINKWFLSVKYDAVNNLIWLGRTTAIVKYDFISEEIIDENDVPALAEGSSIQDIAQDAAGNLWFGANGGKAYRFDGTTWTDFTYGEDFDFVTSIQFKGTKTYFGINGTDAGMYIYDSADETTTHLHPSVDPDMPSSIYNYFTIAPNGDLWFGHNDIGISALKTTVIDGITELSPNTIHVYPNPTSDVLTIDYVTTNKTRYDVLDMQGKLIISANTNNINVQSLAQGLYISKVTDLVTLQTYTTTFSVAK
ncbi:MAG: T9SS type A sorting domain-containing protein [Bacteroidetes bacterium]|nr:T9SS type A sorting domain-containing protein [Bacteroidota bacterium]